MAKKRIKRNNEYFNTYGLGSWMNNVNTKIDASSFGKAMGGASGLGGIANEAANAISGLINTKGNSTGVGNAMRVIGSAASNIPGIGGLIGAGVNLVGGVVNAAWGSNLNKEFIAQTKDRTRQQSNYTSNAEDNTSLLSDWAGYNDMAHVRKSDVGSEGWFSNKAKNKTRSLNKAIDAANLRAWNSLSNTASNVDTNNDFLTMANFSAYGGPILSTSAIGYDLASRDLNNKQMKVLGDMRLTSLPNSFNAIHEVSTLNTFKNGGSKRTRARRVDFDTYTPLYDRGFIPRNMEQLQDSLIARNYNEAQRLAFMSNVLHESGGDPKAVDSSGEYRGIIQWGPDRYPGTKDLGKQIHSLIEEANTPKSPYWSDGGSGTPYIKNLQQGYNNFWNADNPYDATLYYTKGSVRPKKEKARINRAREAVHMSKSLKANGGPLFTHGGIWSNDVTTINNGGSHEQNPYDGVQIGIDPQGIPNLVEEGEVIFNDYVFSDRMKLPKKLKEKYSIKGDTFADAAKELSKESEERPNDPISQRGLETFMNALSESQEEVRIKNEDRRMNRYAKGGKLGNLFEGLGNKSNKLNSYSNYVPLTDNSFYTSEYMDFWNWYKTNQNTPEGQAWLDKINNGEFGSIGGNTFTPQDIIRLSHDYKQGPVHNAFAGAAEQYAKKNHNENSYTPYIKRWIREKNSNGEWTVKPITDEDWNSAPAGRTYLMRNPNLKESNTITSKRGDKDIYYDVIPEEVPEESTDDVTKVEGIRHNPLMYAPIVGSGIAVMNDIFGGNDPDYSNTDVFASAIRNANRPVGTRPIGEYLAYKPLDRMFYINQLNKSAAATRRAAQNTSGGNRAAALAGILAADYNYGENLGQLARQAEEYNQSFKKEVTDFNRYTNMFNSEQGTKVDMFNSELLGKQASLYSQLANMRQKILEGNRAEKSANLTNFIQGLGDLGRYFTDKDVLRWLADIGVLSHNTKGQYTGGNNTAAPKKQGG